MRYDSITEAIGNTPLVRIDPEVHGLAHVDLYAKLELLNPFGSVKDRTSWAMTAPLLESDVTGPEGVIELSSGNTAKALAVIAGMHGLPFTCITNRMKVPEIKELLLLLGARIEELPGQAECLDPTDTEDPLSRIHQSLSTTASTQLHTDQYFNPRNVEAHRTGTGQEIIADLDGVVPDYFIAGVGTAGSSTGVAQALRAHGPGTTVVGLVAHKSDFIPGIRTIDEVHEVGLFDPTTYDTIAAVTADEAIDGMLTLVRRTGILSGPTGGAAYWGAVRSLRSVDAELAAAAAAGEPVHRRTAVFIVCDRVESYLSYVRTRRPELLDQPAAPDSLSSVTDQELAAVIGPDVAEARAWLAQDHALVIDLRSPFAYGAARIAGSVNLVDELFAELLRGGLPFGPDHPVLLVCAVGEKSRRYAALLTRLGHRAVRSLAGGVVAWRDADAPLVRG